MSLLPVLAAGGRGRAALVVSVAFAHGCLAGGGQLLSVDDAQALGGEGGQTEADSNDGRQAVAANHLPPASPCTSHKPAPRTLRRLTQAEYQATVVDLLGGGGVPANDALFVQEPAAYGFYNTQSNLVITRNNLTEVQASAEALGGFAQAHPDRLGPCQSMEATCLAKVAGAWLGRAFRRPPADEEIGDYSGLMATAGDFPQAAEFLVAASLQSPHFLYRSELGQLDRTGSYKLTPYEVASELSYLFTGSMPDAQLQAAAASAALSSPEQVAAQAERLWQSPRAPAVVGQFFLQWLAVWDLVRQVHTERDGTILGDEVKTAMLAQTTALVQQVAFADNGRFADLMSTLAPSPGPALAAFYGNNGAAERLPGVLGLGSWLAAASSSIEASPVMRGRALRMRFLCQSIGSPPSNVPTVAADMTGAKTLRERFGAHIDQPACRGCHNLMDPLAYPLGNYDGLGRRRPGDLEEQLPLDLGGHVFLPNDGQEVDLADGQALATYLGHSAQAADCLSRHLAMYAMGQLMWAEDSCTFAAAAAYAAPSGYNLQQVFIGITQTPSFTLRVQDH